MYTKEILLLTSTALLFIFANNANNKVDSKSILKETPSQITLNDNLIAFPRKFPTNNSNVVLPMIIVLNGRNATEKQLQYAIPENLNARVFFIRPNLKNNLYYVPRIKDEKEIVKPAIVQSGNSIMKAIDLLKAKFNTSRVILFSYSQGSSLNLYLASLGYNDISLSFSGALPENLYPSKFSNTKIRMFHGNLDKVVPYEMGKSTYEAFKAQNYDVEFKERKNSHISPPKEIAFEWIKESLK
jgi:predicted esterase